MKRFIPVILFFVAFTGQLGAQIPAHDASIYKVTLPLYSEFKSIPLSGIFRNSGMDTLHSVIINWSINNGAVHQMSKTGINLTRNLTWAFSAPENLVLNTAGNVVVKVWVSMPNGVADENNTNDTLSQIIQVVEKYPKRTMIIEEVTGAWCGYCPRAPIIFQANVRPSFPNTIMVAMHTSDGMTVADYKDFTNTYVTGVPTGFVDRKKTAGEAGIDFSPESWQPLLTRLDNKFTPLELNVYNYYNPETREWKIDVVADFIFDMSVSYRMNCYILEDSLHGTGSSWDQRNFFNGSASAPYMSLQGAGDPILNYMHNHVVRKMLGGSWGASGVIPATVKKGDRYVYSTTFKADAKWQMKNVHIVGLVQQWDEDKFKRPVINAVEGEVALITGTETKETQKSFRIFPNPAGEIVWVDVKAEQSAAYPLEIINLSGQVLVTQTINYQPGNQQLPVSIKSLTPGVYFIRLTTPAEVWVQKLIKK